MTTPKSKLFVDSKEDKSASPEEQTEPSDGDTEKKSASPIEQPMPLAEVKGKKSKSSKKHTKRQKEKTVCVDYEYVKAYQMNEVIIDENIFFITSIYDFVHDFVNCLRDT